MENQNNTLSNQDEIIYSEENEEQLSLTPIHDFLVRNAERRQVRCYMPGHKGLADPLDITEIHGADSLYESDKHNGVPGIIAKSEAIASELFGSKKTLYSAAGSTLAIQTMLALAKLGGNARNHVIAGRYCHRSFIDSCIQLDLVPSWIYPEEFLSCRISPDDVESRISERTLCVFISSIDYYGGMSDTAAVSQVCKRHGVPLLVDNAHGAYLRFAADGLHPNELGAAMCADSAHKTLPVLTGGAYLHINDPAYEQNAKQMMSLFGSSSPSYLVLDSLDKCNAAVIENPSHISELCEKIAYLKESIAANGFAVAKSDPMRITIDCRKMNTTGYMIENMLSYSEIECEYSDNSCCVLLFGWGTSDDDLHRVNKAFKDNKDNPFSVSFMPGIPPTIKTPAAITPSKAFFSSRIRLPLEEAIGKVCAEVIAPCPPGIPIIMPGEIINKETAAALEYYKIEAIDIAFCR